MNRIRIWIWFVAIGCVAGGVLHFGPGASVLAQSAAGAVNQLAPGEQAQGWRLLFDGSSLKGWSPVGTADWQVKDGALTFTTGRGVLQSADSFQNFQLRLEFWAEQNANSGVFVRVSPRGQGSAFYEINIFDPHPTAPTGSLIAVEPGKAPAPVSSTLPKRYETAGKWNSFEIQANGPRLQVTLNGALVTDSSDDPLKLAGGPIQLQAGGPDGPGIARFRSIRIKTL